VVVLVFPDHPHRPLTDLRRISAWFSHDSILSRNGASGNPGAIQYKKLTAVAQELVKNKAFIKKGVYTIPIPLAGAGVHVWIGRKYAETMLVGSGKGLFGL